MENVVKEKENQQKVLEIEQSKIKAELERLVKLLNLKLYL